MLRLIYGNKATLKFKASIGLLSYMIHGVSLGLYGILRFSFNSMETMLEFMIIRHKLVSVASIYVC